MAIIKKTLKIIFNKFFFKYTYCDFHSKRYLQDIGTYESSI